MIVGTRVPLKRSRRPFSLALRRVAEIEKLILYRVGGALAGEAAPLVLGIIAAHLDHGDALGWATYWVPEIAPDAAVRIIADGARRRWRAAHLGDALALTAAERIACEIRTIRPAGVSGRAFKAHSRARKRQLDRERDEAARRQRGAKPRRKGDAASEEAAKLGVSRATLYRKRKAQRDAVKPQTREYNAHKDTRELRVSPASWAPAARALLARAATALRRPIRAEAA